MNISLSRVHSLIKQMLYLGICSVIFIAPANAQTTPETSLSSSTNAPTADEQTPLVEDKNAPTVRIIDPSLPMPQETQAVNPEDFTDTATLQGLDKITARVSPIPLTTGKTTHFGNLEITLHRCWRAPMEEEPESKAFLEITEQVPGEKKQHLFRGWMLASSPALSALEHPVYDITLISCTSSKDIPPPVIPAEKILNKPLEIDNLQDLD
jgi:hypothetical protein